MNKLNVISNQIMLLASFLTINLPGVIHASIERVHDSSIIGNGTLPQDGFNITRDTDSGLDWLDLTLSTNRSFGYVNTQFGVGGDYEGFRVATDLEIGELFLNAGAPSINGSGLGFNVAAELLLSAVGTTVVNSAGTFGSGFRHPNTAPATFRSVSQYADFAQPLVFVAAGYASDVASAQHGTWLVRDSPVVPEPLSLFVWGGLVLCAYTTAKCLYRAGDCSPKTGKK